MRFILLQARPGVAGAESGDDGAVRARLGLPAGGFLLYLGGFDARKNVPRTIEAYAQLAQRMTAEGREPPAFVIAGAARRRYGLLA